MSKISEKIRAAAIGPAPGGNVIPASWVGRKLQNAVLHWYRPWVTPFATLSEDGQRTFLLFVAEAEK